MNISSNTLLALVILLGNLICACKVKQPLFSMPFPQSSNIPTGKVIRVAFSPNHNYYLFRIGIFHRSVKNEISIQRDSSSYWIWGVFYQDENPNLLKLYSSFIKTPENPLCNTYALDSSLLNISTKVYTTLPSKYSRFVKIDTIEYSFPIESVLLFKELKKREMRLKDSKPVTN